MPYVDFGPRKMWLSSQVEERFLRVTAAPLPLRQLRMLMRHFGWEDHWALVYAIQRHAAERFERLLQENAIAHTLLNDGEFMDRHYLFEPGELRKLDADFWSILAILLPPDLDRGALEKLHGLSFRKLHRRAFAEFGAVIHLGIDMFDEHAIFEIPQPMLAERIWSYLVESHLGSLGGVSPDHAERVAGQLPFRDLKGQHLLYWGRRTAADGKIEFAYLMLEGKQILAPEEWATYSDYQKEYYPFLRRYQFSDELPCLLLGENACESVRFGKVRNSLHEPPMPLFFRDHRYFLWGIIPRPQGVVFSMEPFRFRHYVDFLEVAPDAQVFIHSVEQGPVYDFHTHEPAPFWLSTPARQSLNYFSYDDYLHHRSALDGEYHFVLTDAETSREEIETILGTSEEAPWFSFSEFFGENGSVPPIGRVGSAWDEHVSGIYLERPDDIESLTSHVVWGMFRERFDHFPGGLPDTDFCTQILDYLRGIDGRVKIDWEDFLGEGDIYRVPLAARCKGPVEFLPQERRATIRYQDGEWLLEQ